MSGYSSVFILAILTLTIIPISYLSWYNNQVLLSSYENLISTINERIISLRSYSVEVNESTIKWENDTSLSFWVLNSGSISIPVRDLKYIDLILIYELSRGGRSIIWIPYNPNGIVGSEIFWRIEGVRVGNGSPEIINKIYPSPGKYNVSPESGQWDPGEELLIVVYLTQSMSANTTALTIIVVSLKSGATCYAVGE